MIDVKSFYDSLIKREINFFTGVPDSLLKDICAYIADHSKPENNVITANEGGAIALGAGYHLATNKVPLIYMQNSGIGNAINPLLSLVDKEVYSIPMILMVGWRGEPGVKDEPQHIKQGRVLLEMFNSIEIPYLIIDKDSDFDKSIDELYNKAIDLSGPVALIVKKGAFSTYQLANNEKENWEMSREEALSEILQYIPKDAVIVSTTGMLSRELFEIRERRDQSHQTDFLTVGSMGHSLQIASGIALSKPNKMVYCLDGDGAAIMHLGNYAVAGSLKLPNLRVIVFNNEAHDSVGGQRTVGGEIKFGAIATASNMTDFGVVKRKHEISEKLMADFNKNGSVSFLEVKIKKGARKDLGRPTSSPVENKNSLKEFLSR